MFNEENDIFINNAHTKYCNCDTCIKEFNGLAIYDTAIEKFESIYKEKTSWRQHLLAAVSLKKD